MAIKKANSGFFRTLSLAEGGVDTWPFDPRDKIDEISQACTLIRRFCMAGAQGNLQPVSAEIRDAIMFLERFVDYTEPCFSMDEIMDPKLTSVSSLEISQILPTWVEDFSDAIRERIAQLSGRDAQKHQSRGQITDDDLPF